MDSCLSLKMNTTFNGMISNDIKDIYYDPGGTMWFAGKGGLSRFDGYEFINFSTNTLADSLNSNNIIKIFPAGGNDIWLLTQNGDIIVFNITTTTSKRLQTGLSSDKRINTITFVDEKSVLIGTTQGLYRYNMPSGEIALLHYRDNFDRKNTAPVRTLYKDSKGNIWVGTWADGIYVIEAGGIHVRQIGSGDALHGIRANEFIEGENGRIFVATWGNGLVEITRPTEHSPQIRHYTVDPKNKEMQNWDIIYSVCFDGAGNLWMGTPKGVRVLNSAREETFCAKYKNINGKGKERNINEVYKVLMDAYGEMWLSLFGNGAAVNIKKDNLIKYDDLTSLNLDSNCIDALYEDSRTGYMWMGVQGYGLVIYDPERQMMLNSGYDGLISRINKQSNSVKSFCENKAGDRLYIATRYDGVFILDRQASRISEITHITIPNEPETRCACMAMDKDDRAYVITRSGGVLIIVPDKEGGPGSYKSETAGEIEELISSEIVSCMIIDRGGNLWIGMENHGVLKLKYDTGANQITGFERISVSDTDCRGVTTLFQDSKGRIWSGTQSGLKLYNPRTACFNSIDELQNVRSEGVSQITEDKNGNLWLAASSRIIRYSPDSPPDGNKYSCYVNDKTTFMHNAIINNGNTISMGGYNGIVSFNPLDLPVRGEAIAPMIADILIFNRSILSFPEQDRHRISEKMPPFTDRIEVKYNENSISFKFSATSFGENSLYDYAYMMDGVDSNWQYASSAQRVVTYSNLNPGEYRFRIRACDQLGTWSDKIAALDIIVKKAPWLSIWAVCGYALLFIAVCTYIIMRVLQNAREKRRQYLERLDRIKTEDIYNAKLTFFTNVSHELFTPITVISCSLDKLLGSNGQNPAPYLLMRSNLNRLMRLLQQIMEFSKADSANLKLKVAQGDISAFIRQMCNENFNVADDRNISLEFCSTPDSIVGYFDSDKLDKIMYNLISNAFKYNRPNGRVFVSLTREEHNVTIDVRDTGYGIRQERLPDIFKRFYEGEYRKFKTKGTGIGLSLTNDLVKLHNGTIHVQSIVNQGTVFTVVLPVDRQSYSEDQIDTTTLNNEPSIAEQTSVTKEALNREDFQHTILLVEDNRELLEAMKELMSMKYNVLTAKDGIEALGIAREKLIDIVITDYQMPNMAGDELCRVMRSDIELSHIPIIMLSVYSSKEYKLRSFEAGADAYVVKPFDTSVLLAQVNSIIENHKRIIRTFEESHDLNTSGMTNNDLDKQFIDKIIEHVKSNLINSEFDNNSLCAATHMSNSTLYRKIKSITGLSPQEFIRKVRFKIAGTMLLDKNNNISEVAYQLGYTDAKYFSTCFKKEFGMSPREFVKSNTKLPL